MWIDLFVSAPVTLFLLWLYWYSRPAAAPRWSRIVDAAVLIASPAAVVAIIVVGHATVLALGVTSAGLQAIRLEYVEFFQKFYEGGGGEPYEPFGHEGRARS